MPRSTNSLFGLALDTFQLGLEAQTVIGLRLARFAQGDAGALMEANLMVAEKAQALVELQTRMALSAVGGPQVTPRHALAHYRRKVRANRRRLSR